MVVHLTVQLGIFSFTLVVINVKNILKMELVTRLEHLVVCLHVEVVCWLLSTCTTV